MRMKVLIFSSNGLRKGTTRGDEPAPLPHGLARAFVLETKAAAVRFECEDAWTGEKVEHRVVGVRRDTDVVQETFLAKRLHVELAAFIITMVQSALIVAAQHATLLVKHPWQLQRHIHTAAK